jgi:hypothetical protein
MLSPPFLAPLRNYRPVKAIARPSVRERVHRRQNLTHTHPHPPGPTVLGLTLPS